MESDLIHIKPWLKPLAWLYGAGVSLRNSLFNSGILKEKKFDIPIICIGNLTVGGTGKTPHTEMLLRKLLPDYKVAVLSRGYKRKSRGFHLADSETPMPVIGDEPWQMKHNFPQAVVAVDANRRRGIQRLLEGETTRDIDVIIMDDAYQHRYVKADINILLTDYHRLFSDDYLLPAGTLREHKTAKERAHIVVVTKCPANMKPMDFRVVEHRLSLRPWQKLYFSTFRYGRLRHLFNDHGQIETLSPGTDVLLLTGIASPVQMIMDLQRFTRNITPLAFADHHQFTRHDVRTIEEAFTAMQGSKRLIITTEKDASRLLILKDLSPIVRRHIYVLPIEVEIMQDKGEELLNVVKEAITL